MMGVFKTVAEYERNLAKFARQFPEAVRQATEAVIHEKMVKDARKTHPRRHSLKEQKLIALKSIAMRKAGRKPKPGPSGRRFQSWGGGGGLVGAIDGRAALVGKTVYGRLQAKKKYAHYVEYGTTTAAPHPFLRPALMNNKDYLRRILLTGAAKAAKKGTRLS